MNDKLKSIALSVIFGVIYTVLLYFIVAFVVWDMDAENWGVGSRYFVAVFSLATIFLGILTTGYVKGKL